MRSNKSILCEKYKCKWVSELYSAIAINPNLELILEAMEEARRAAVMEYITKKNRSVRIIKLDEKQVSIVPIATS